ncbi:nitroreductase family protein [Candidatus Saccharibacteria bacterium]|nr:nitroreductase family protein [Candidatus Saccharibacteria bacterium]
MTIKEMIKALPGASTIINQITGIEFWKDKRFFYGNSVASNKNTANQLEYKLLTELHKLEKGFGATNQRPFGVTKVKTVIRLLDSNKIPKESYAHKLAESMLVSYKELYEENQWTELDQYKKVCDYIDRNPCRKTIGYGAKNVAASSLKTINIVEYASFLSRRHSTRSFSGEKVSDVEIKKAIDAAILSPSACNRQPCKVYHIKKRKNISSLKAILPGFNLFDTDNMTLLVVTFDMSFALFVGERNQGWFNSGLFSMNLVNALHAEDIGTCFLQWGERFSIEKKVKRQLGIPDSERIAVVIACGHYKNRINILHSARRPTDEIYRTD